MIAIFIGKFLAHAPVRIDWDGEQTRDYVYVSDVAQANLAALDRGSGDALVIGTGVKTSVNQIYRALVRISGFEAPVEHAPQRPGDARDAQFDASPARVQLGWSPSISLDDGIRATLRVFRAASAGRIGRGGALSGDGGRIASRPGKLEKVAVLAEYFRSLGDADLLAAARFFTGTPFAARDRRTLFGRRHDRDRRAPSLGLRRCRSFTQLPRLRRPRGGARPARTGAAHRDALYRSADARFARRVLR